jgi:hypothetical protein
MRAHPVRGLLGSIGMRSLYVSAIAALLLQAASGCNSPDTQGGGGNGAGGNGTGGENVGGNASSSISAGGSAPSACSDDADCNHGATGSNVICATSGAQAGSCIPGCHKNTDCDTGDTCDLTTMPEPTCVGPKPPPSNGCPVLTFPSGIQIQTVPKASMTASYSDHLLSGQKAPKCFIDVTQLYDPSNQQTYDISVHVATHFQLSELVGTEVDQGYGNFVLLNPDAVEALEKFREAANQAVSINSGFRSPKHQEDVCNSLCGHPLGCPGTCANASRHMWGDAFDLPLEFYTSHYTNLACDAGFKFTYLESGTHLHIDQNPEYAQCVQE